ncbi:MAG TPA: hypothetical protein PLZ55_14105 [bacterium]|nr:hypothetical protein [bacterium]HQQ00604.1 hypothetical protein [bacterium]
MNNNQSYLQNEEPVSANIVQHKAGHLAGIVPDKSGGPADGLAEKTENAKGVQIEDRMKGEN